MRWLAALALVLAACASAGVGDNPADGPPGDSPATGSDAPRLPDGPPVDAMPQPVTLSQNTSTVPNSTKLGCSNSLTGYTAENSFYRVFPLADAGVTGSYEVQSVTFAIHTANGAGTSQAAQVKIGRYNGTVGGTLLSLTDIVPINAAQITIPDGATSMTAPITGVLPPGANLIVELALPDGRSIGNVFFVGSNAAGESRPGYIRAPACGDAVPRSMNVVAAEAGVGKVDLIMTVAGVKY